MAVAQIDEAAYGKGLNFRGWAVQSDIDKLLDIQDWTIALSGAQTPGRVSEMALALCLEYEVPVSHNGPMARWASFVAGVKGEHVPCGAFLPVARSTPSDIHEPAWSSDFEGQSAAPLQSAQPLQIAAKRLQLKAF